MQSQLDVREALIREQFTDTEWNERSRHIATLKNFAGASVAAANALSEIRDKKLYRPHKTLKEFCQRECGWSERHLFRVLKFAKVRASLPPKTDQLVSRESQARELANVPEEQRVEVLNEAKKNGEITAASIRRAAENVSTNADSERSGAIQDGLGYPVPEAAQAFWSRKDEAKEVLGKIRAAKSAVKALDTDDPMWAEVNLNGVLGDLSNAINRFAAAVPSYVCVYCQGLSPQLKKCTTCKGRGIVSKFMWSMIPEELRKMRESQVK